MKTLCALSLATLLLLATTSVQAVTILSQDFEPATPVNYTNSAFFVADYTGQTGTRYFNLSSAVGAGLNTNLTGATGAYLTVQNADTSGDNPLGAVGLPAYTDAAPPTLTFNSTPVSGFSNLQLSISLAGSPSVENINYIRAVVDLDGDTNYETTLFSFQGGNPGNDAPYKDAGPNLLTPDLSLAFGVYTVNIPQPTSGNLNLRLLVYNDTNSLNENSGIDNIVVTGTPVPEPSSIVLGAFGLVGLVAGAIRRRRSN